MFFPLGLDMLTKAQDIFLLLAILTLHFSISKQCIQNCSSSSAIFHDMGIFGTLFLYCLSHGNN